MATAATPKKASEPRASDADDPAKSKVVDADGKTVAAKAPAAADDTGKDPAVDKAKDMGITGDNTTTTSVTGTVATTDGKTVAAADEPDTDEPAGRRSDSRTAKVARGECVVDDGTPHTGRAVNGVICSAHAMRYDANGKLRGAA